jgi:hypothetical protein
VAEEEEQMYPQRLVSQALRLGLLVSLVVLVLGACGAGEKEAKPRPLPEEQQTLSPGTYLSEEFKPSLSLTVGEGWANATWEVSDSLTFTRRDTGELRFVNAQKVYEPTKTGTANVVEAPKDMVGWFQHHPHLQTDKPKTDTVGGVKGVQFDVVVGEMPESYSGTCGSDCVDLFRVSASSTLGLPKGYKARVIVLENVKGETVTIGWGSPVSEFAEFAPEAQKVIGTVKWTGS